MPGTIGYGNIVPKSFHFWDNITIPYRTRHLGKYGLFSLKRVVGWHIKDPLLQKVINIQCGDHGMPPAKASFPYHCALMDHYFKGGFYPMGGGAAIVKAMTNAIKKHGGQVITGVSVKKIVLEGDVKNRRAIGIELASGEMIMAKNIVSNTDPAVTYRLAGVENLSEKLQAKLAKTKYSVTSLMFFVTVDMDVKAAGMDSGNIWLMPNRDMDDIYEDLKKIDIAEKDEFDALFINCSTLKDPSSYDGHHHLLEIITFIDYKSFSQFKDEGEIHSAAYTKFKERLCQKLVNTMEKVLPGIGNHIVQMELGTPMTNEHYINATRGNVYGTEKGFWQTGPFSYGYTTEIQNLYMCGASIMSHGVAGASYSGVKTAAIVLNCKEEDIIKPDEAQHIRIYDAEDKTLWPPSLHLKIAQKQKRVKKQLIM